MPLPSYITYWKVQPHIVGGLWGMKRAKKNQAKRADNEVKKFVGVLSKGEK